MQSLFYSGIIHSSNSILRFCISHHRENIMPSSRGSRTFILALVASLALVGLSAAHRDCLFAACNSESADANTVSYGKGSGHARGTADKLAFLSAAYTSDPSAAYIASPLSTVPGADPWSAVQPSDNIQGVFDTQIIGFKNELVGHCFENFYAYSANLWPSVVIYNRSGDVLVETSRLMTPERHSNTNGIVSRNPARRYVVNSRMTPKSATAPLVLYAPANFTINIFALDWSNGVVSQTPSYSINMKDIDPALYDATAAYNGIAGLSEDGRFLVLTYARLSFVPFNGSFIPVLSQRISVAEIYANGTGMTMRQTIDMPHPPNVNYIYFTQRALMKQVAPGKHAIVIAANSYSVTGVIDPFGITGSLLTYSFNEEANTLNLTGNLPYNQYCQGFDISPDNTRIAIINVQVGGPEGIFTRLAYANGAPKPFDNFRVYSFNALATENAIALVNSVNTYSSGVNVRYSNDGRKIAVVSSPNYYATIVPNGKYPGQPLTRIFSNSMLQVVNAKKDRIDDVLTGYPVSASPIALGVAWSDDDTRIALGGMASPVAADAILYAYVQ